MSMCTMLIHDWILYPPTKEITHLYKIHHERLCRHVSDITNALLHLFFQLTIISEFSILYGMVIRMREGDENALYEELLTYDTKHDVYAIQAILEDNCICSNAKGWIAYAFHELWPFITGYSQSTPGIYAWKEGNRIIPVIHIVPFISRPIPAEA